MFSSCAWQNGSGKNPNESDPKTFTVEDVEKTSVDHLWDGYEELQGASYGKTLSLPEKINIYETDKVYRFKLNKKTDFDNLQDGKKFFSDFFGDNFDESICKLNSDVNRLEYRVGEVVSVYQNGLMFAYKNTSDIFMGESDKDESKDPYIASFKAVDDSDKVLELDKGSSKISELCGTVKEFCEKELYPTYEEFEIVPFDVIHYKTKDMRKQAEVVCQLRYKGIPLEDRFSPLLKIQPGSEPGESTNTYYIPNYILFELDQKDNINAIYTACTPQKIEGTEVNELISFKGAVNILATNLAPNSEYEFEDVQLMYCCKRTTMNKDANDPDPEFKDVAEPYFEPTWCFFWDTFRGGFGRQAIKVNAITGEITIDTPTGK